LESYTNGDGDSDGKRLSTVSERLKAGISFLLKEEDCVLHNGFDTDTYRISRRSKTQGEKIVSGDLYGQNRSQSMKLTLQSLFMIFQLKTLKISSQQKV